MDPDRGPLAEPEGLHCEVGSEGEAVGKTLPRGTRRHIKDSDVWMGSQGIQSQIVIRKVFK